MKNSIRLLAAAILAALMSLGFAGSSQAYPDDPGVTIDVGGGILVGGNSFDFTASADFSGTTSDDQCDWTVTYSPAVDGTTRTGAGTSISGSFDTPPVDVRTPTTITASCAFNDDPAAAQAAASPATASAVVTLLPLEDAAGGSGGGGLGGLLPDTGGSSLWILIAGGALVVVGGGAYIASRRRA